MRALEMAIIVFGTSLPLFARETLPGFDSPEKAFQAYVKSVASGDYDLLLSSLTPEARAYHLSLSLFSAAFLFSADPEMEGIFREHGIDTSSKAGPEKEEPDQDAADKALVAAMSKIKDPARLMKRIADRHEKLAKLMVKSGDARPEAKRLSESELLSSVTLGKISMKSDSAEATVTVAASARNIFVELPEKVQFRRINNRWYCHIDPR